MTHNIYLRGTMCLPILVYFILNMLFWYGNCYHWEYFVKFSENNILQRRWRNVIKKIKTSVLLLLQHYWTIYKLLLKFINNHERYSRSSYTSTTPAATDVREFSFNLRIKLRNFLIDASYFGPVFRKFWCRIYSDPPPIWVCPSRSFTYYF